MDFFFEKPKSKRLKVKLSTEQFSVYAAKPDPHVAYSLGHTSENAPQKYLRRSPIAEICGGGHRVECKRTECYD